MPGTKVFCRALACGLLALGLVSSAHAQCQLNSPSGKIKHVVYVEFDNVHFIRDNPNVPSDLEQMPKPARLHQTEWRSRHRRPHRSDLAHSQRHFSTQLRLGQIYKQINAPFGSLAQSTLTVSNFAIQSTSDNDGVYNALENRIASWTTQRDALTAQMKQLLSGAPFSGLAINEQQAK